MIRTFIRYSTGLPEIDQYNFHERLSCKYCNAFWDNFSKDDKD